MGRLVTVTGVVDGDTLSFLFDTAAGETLITPTVATRIGCEPSGRTVGFRMTGEQVEFGLCEGVPIEIGGRSFPHAEIGVFDIASLLPVDWPPLGGVLSLKTFANHAITLDLQNRHLVVENRTSLAARVATMEVVPSRMASGTDGHNLTLLLHGTAPAPGWYLFDSANLDVVGVGAHLPVRSGAGGMGDGEAEPVRLTGLSSVDVPWRVRELIYDGALSEAFIRQWVVTMNLVSETVWAVRAESR